jgi:hypothetical protein
MPNHQPISNLVVMDNASAGIKTTLRLPQVNTCAPTALDPRIPVGILDDWEGQIHLVAAD